MAKKSKKLVSFAVAAVLTVSSASGLIALTGCKPNEDDKPTGLKQGTYRTFTATMPSNWNELTYQDNNDRQILENISGSLFTFDYDFGGKKFNDDGTINKDGIVAGGFTVAYDGVSKLEDVTATVDAKWGYTAEQKAEGGYAYKLTFRQDLKWDDGTPIKAEDFIYSMQEQLNPKFLNFRANTWYDTIRIKGAYNYLYQGAPLFQHVVGLDADGNPFGYVADADFTKDDDGFYKFPSTVATAEDDAYVYSSTSKADMFFGEPMSAFYSSGYTAYFRTPYEEEVDPDNLPDYVVAVTNKDETVSYFFDYYLMMADMENEYGYLKVNDKVREGLMSISTKFGDGRDVSWQEFCFYVSGYGEAYDWDTVGYYATGDYELIMCMDSPINMLDDEDNLTYNAPYHLSTLPLVKKDLYESCKKAPATGALLWTSTYNTSADTTASWGPYKLDTFQSGKSYTLVRNDKFYGFNMDEYKNQFNVTKVECERIADTETAWMSFFSGKIDSKGLDNTYLESYKNSKFTVYSPDTATFGLQIYSGLDAIKNNGRNNGILAIPEFRQAMSLALAREEFATDILAPNQAAYGVLNSQYYYDIENGGVYRYSTQAKEGLLRAYGYTQAADGTWSNASGDITGYPTDDAYATLGGSNMTKATELVKAAYAKLTADKEFYGYDESKNISILIGWSAPNKTYTNAYNYFKSAWEEMAKGTPLEGKIDVKYDENRGSKWSDDFKAGKYDISPLSGISGNPLDPYDLIRCYIDPNYALNYHQYWDTNKVSLTIKFGEDDTQFSGKEYTMSALNWYCSLNGIAATYKDQYGLEFDYNMDNGYLSESNRLLILAALEELVLKQYQFVPLVSSYSASLVGAKFSYISDEYNMFLGFGGYRYMVVNYTDSEWATFVSQNNNNLTEFYKASD